MIVAAPRIAANRVTSRYRAPRVPAAGSAARPVTSGTVYTGAGAQDPAAFYRGLINSDPSVIQGGANLRAQGIQAGSNAGDAVRNLLIQYGGVPAAFKDQYGWVDPQTRELAGQSTTAGLSTLARLQKAYADTVDQRQRALAARGMIASGGLTQTLGEADLQNRQQQYDALNQLLSQINQQRSQFAQGELDRSQQLQQLQTDAAGRAATVPMPAAPVEQPWQRALRLRSQALNAKYGLR